MSRGTNKMHDLNNFSLRETKRFLGIVNAACKQHLRSKIVITIKVKLSVKLSKPKPNLYKYKVPNTNSKNSSLILSSLLVIIEKKRLN